MQDILFHYQPIAPTTWVYISSLLMLALYFKFSRLWSLRNLDLVLLILLAPGLVLVDYGQNRHVIDIERIGFIWMFAVGGFLLLHMLLDSVMVRRPLLEPNLNLSGMVFLGLSLFIFLMAKVMTIQPWSGDVTPTIPAVKEVLASESAASSSSTSRDAKQIVTVVTTDVASKTEVAKGNAAENQTAATETKSTETDSPASETTPPESSILLPKKPAQAVDKLSVNIDPTERLNQVGPGFWLFNLIPNLTRPIYEDPEASKFNHRHNKPSISPPRGRSTSARI